MSHSYRSPSALEPMFHNKINHCNEKPSMKISPTLSNKRKPAHSKEDPVQPKINKIFLNLSKFVIFWVAILILKIEGKSSILCFIISGKVKTQLKHTHTHTKKICAVYGEGAVIDQICQKWFAKFSARDSSLDDAPWLKLIAIKSRH